MADKNALLATRMRPTKLEDVVGQEEVLKPDSIIHNMIVQDKLFPILLYGPPGTGKTTIATLIAANTNADFHKVNAVAAGKKDLEDVIKIAKKNRENDVRTILFIDEIHRFNKTQQDYLLPFVEDNIITLMGATTENPFFEVNAALISRMKLIQLKAITAEDIKKAVLRALTDTMNGLGQTNQTIDDDALTLLSIQANGDVRYALNTLEIASTLAYGKPNITIADIQNVIQKPNLNYDKDGDAHYDTISAFIKSMRGSDPNGTVYYLARMLEAGEDPKFIARRIMVHASEDVGLADPMALVVATAAAEATERIGLPEARINLAQAALYVALAPKSNSVIKAIDAACSYVHDNPTDDIPDELRDAHYKSASKLGHGVGYKYPHDYPNHFVHQRYLPKNVNEIFYYSDNMGYQVNIDNYQRMIRTDNQQP